MSEDIPEYLETLLPVSARTAARLDEPYHPYNFGAVTPGAFVTKSLGKQVFEKRAGTPWQRRVRRKNPAWLSSLAYVVYVDVRQLPARLLCFRYPHGVAYKTKVFPAMKAQIVLSGLNPAGLFAGIWSTAEWITEKEWQAMRHPKFEWSGLKFIPLKP
jgi:hypothetical protein